MHKGIADKEISSSCLNYLGTLFKSEEFILFLNYFPQLNFLYFSLFFTQLINEDRILNIGINLNMTSIRLKVLINSESLLSKNQMWMEISGPGKNQRDGVNFY